MRETVGKGQRECESKGERRSEKRALRKVTLFGGVKVERAE